MDSGYAVIDVETTGLHPGWNHRIVEIAILRIDRHGQVIDEWSTLVNPNRDLGPQHIHGITAAEARRAPRFVQVAGEVAARLTSNVIVGHNVSFDLRFLIAEFALLGVDVPVGTDTGLCTMRLSGRYLTSTARSLATCCAAAGITLEQAHSALHDARATAGLMTYFLRAAGHPPPWHAANSLTWPDLPRTADIEVHRGSSSSLPGHFLARLVDGLPRVPVPPRADEYLAVLDRALLDRHLSITEQDELVGVAQDLGLTRGDTEKLHHRYLQALAERAWADAVVTTAESDDLRLVAGLLGLGDDEVGQSLSAAREAVDSRECPWDSFQLRRGDPVVFTGQMAVPREVWTERAVHAGLGVQPRVTRTTRLVVAADPDSLSGKAKLAHTYRIPIITEGAFESLLDRLHTRETQR